MKLVKRSEVSLAIIQVQLHAFKTFKTGWMLTLIFSHQFTELCVYPDLKELGGIGIKQELFIYRGFLVMEWNGITGIRLNACSGLG